VAFSAVACQHRRPVGDHFQIGFSAPLSKWDQLRLSNKVRIVSRSGADASSMKGKKPYVLKLKKEIPASYWPIRSRTR
jgi:hypothetical protein